MAQKTQAVGADGNIVKETNPLQVGGDGFRALMEILQEIRDELRMSNNHLEDIGK